MYDRSFILFSSEILYLYKGVVTWYLKHLSCQVRIFINKLFEFLKLIRRIKKIKQMKISNDCLTSVAEVTNKMLIIELWNIENLYATLNLKSS